MNCKSYSHFFSKKFQHICVSLDVNFNESLTNDIVSFEQLGPGYLAAKPTIQFEPAHDKTYKMACTTSEDSDQPVPPRSLIRVFAVRLKKPCVLRLLSYLYSALWRLWSNWADTQADLSLRWAHKPFCSVFFFFFFFLLFFLFSMRWLIYVWTSTSEHVPSEMWNKSKKKDCFWKQKTHKITKIGDSVWLSLFIGNTVVCEAAPEKI